MRRIVITFVMLPFAPIILPCVAQTLCQLPFGSTANTIELTVANTSAVASSDVTVEISNLPSWLRFAATEQRIGTLKAGEEASASFSFSVDKSAPVRKEQKLSFIVSSAAGERWSKEITISVSPPDRFELFRNYPNPFNPATTISYQLSADAKVSLKVFDVLGREVATIVDGDRLAGHYEERWNAALFSSGTYIYQLIASDERGNRLVARKAMLLVK
jgi:hypothetical protein